MHTMTKTHDKRHPYRYRGILIDKIDTTPHGFWGRWRARDILGNEVRAGSLAKLKVEIDASFESREALIAKREAAAKAAPTFNRTLVSDTKDVLQRENCGNVYVELSYYLNHRTGETYYAVSLYDMSWVSISKDKFSTLDTGIAVYNRAVQDSKVEA